MKNLAKNLLVLRSRNNLKQSDLKKELGVKQNTWSNWEKGISEPSVDSLIQISKHFGVSLDALIQSDLSNEQVPGDHALSVILKRLADVEQRLTLIEDRQK